MPRTKPNYLWRAVPTPRSVADTCELQTLAFDPNTRKPEWLTVAQGEPTAIESIATRLSADRFRMFPLVADEPGWPKEQGVLDDDPEEGEPLPTSGDEAAEIARSGLSGSSSTTRRPAIREPASRRALTGAAARSAQRRREREQGGRDGSDKSQ